jgi:hypothetical protein
MGKENVVQGAIAAALEVYGDRHRLHTDGFAPYANQQGIGPNQFIADLVVRMEKRPLLLLEVKELDLVKGTLPAYNLRQHGDDILQEVYLKIPILYGYAAVEQLAYLGSDRGAEWPQKTLLNVKIARPSQLVPLSQIGQTPVAPASSHHSNLLEWLLRDPPATARLATLAALGGLPSHEMRNKQVVILAAGGGVQILPATGVATIVREFIGASSGDEAEATPGASFMTDEIRTLRDDLKNTIDEQRRQLEDVEQFIGQTVDQVLHNLNGVVGSEKEDEQFRERLRLRAIRGILLHSSRQRQQNEPLPPEPSP